MIVEAVRENLKRNLTCKPVGNMAYLQEGNMARDVLPLPP
jgi:hypothetical protein